MPHKLKKGVESAVQIPLMRTENGVNGAFKKDFGDILCIRAEEYADNPDKELYKKNSDVALKFDPDSLAIWVKAQNDKIRKIIRERLLANQASY